MKRFWELKGKDTNFWLKGRYVNDWPNTIE